MSCRDFTSYSPMGSLRSPFSSKNILTTTINELLNFPPQKPGRQTDTQTLFIIRIGRMGQVGFSEPRGHRDCSINSLHHCSAFLHLNSLSRCAIVTTYTCPSSVLGNPLLVQDALDSQTLGHFVFHQSHWWGGQNHGHLWLPILERTPLRDYWSRGSWVLYNLIFARALLTLD